MQEAQTVGGYKASFDLTDFPSPEAFQTVLDETGLSLEEGVDPFDLDDGWNWTGDCVVVHTYANPLTGERAGMPDRAPEPGYASYIHVQGDEERVREVYEAIRRYASYTKEASLGKWVV